MLYCQLFPCLVSLQRSDNHGRDVMTVPGYPASQLTVTLSQCPHNNHSDSKTKSGQISALEKCVGGNATTGIPMMPSTRRTRFKLDPVDTQARR